MDPERVRAYLQVACAGLGFDIGEVWWTSNENGSSTVATIEENKGGTRNLRFVQLYTSKSYEDRRSMLVSPEKDEESTEPNSEVAIQKHVLSPQLVNAISNTAQVLWANSQQTGGLLGKSDVRLQTAVGMPVAVDGNGNMCVVVMFSPNHIKNTDDAMEYLQFISKSATSSSIPCLLPVFNNDMRAVIPANSGRQQFLTASLGDGVTANFVTLDVTHQSDLSHAQKDGFGIPLLPGMELDVSGDAFDEASYGVWNTIMDMDTPQTSIVALDQPAFPTVIRERIEEFLTAFLSMSVFDAADIWIPREPGLCHEVTVLAADSLQEFQTASEGIFVQNWSGAVGRAYASGNPIWSHVPDVIFDQERRQAFEKAGIQTALAVPVANCVLCCYSLVRTDPVPFVLKFLQQALRLLWVGLDNVDQPQVGQEIWKEVGPTDLGEMAADLEMHHEFLRKKRPHSVMQIDEIGRDRSESLALQFDTLSSSPSQMNVPISSNSQFCIEPYQEVEPASIVYVSQNPIVIDDFQNHMRDALQAVGQAVPWAVTNAEGTKRVHMTTDRESVNHNNTGRVEQIPFAYSNQSAPSIAEQDRSRQPASFAFVGSQTDRGPVNMHQSSNFASGPTYDFAHSGVQEQYQTCFEPMQSNPPSNSNQSMQSSAPSITNQRVYQTYDQPMAPQLNSSSPLQPSPLHMPGQLPNRIIQVPAAPPGSVAHLDHMNSYSQHQFQQVDNSGCNLYQQSSGMMLPQGYDVSQSPSPTHAVVAPTPSNVDPVLAIFCASTASPPIAGPNSGNKFCRIQGCCEPAVARRPYCAAHSGNRICENPGCGKCAQGSTRFCIAHGGGRRCTFPGCDKGARDKYFCAAHGGGKRCAMDGCSKSAVGGSSLCTGHGGGRRCSVDGCDKSAQSSTRFCVKHGGGKTCGHPGCPKVARGRTSYCAAHGGGIRCKLDGCNRVAIGKLQLCRAHGGGARTKANATIMTSGAT